MMTTRRERSTSSLFGVLLVGGKDKCDGPVIFTMECVDGKVVRG